MYNSNIYKDLIVLDIANNHFGSIIMQKIIDQFSKIIKKYKINSTFNFNLNLDTFIHKI